MQESIDGSYMVQLIVRMTFSIQLIQVGKRLGCKYHIYTPFFVGHFHLKITVKHSTGSGRKKNGIYQALK